MNKFKVTSGNVTREVEAANTAEARRKFHDVDDPANTDVTLVEVLEEPRKMRYRVTWGDQVREVIAVHEADAWSQFVGGRDDTPEYKFPNMHQRLIEELGPAAPEGEAKAKKKKDADSDTAADEAADTEATSPVADVDAVEAKDQISRMHSHEKLQQIVANDPRVTVQNTARNRLKEIGG